MESSRVFVRGLPPNISEQEFKKHFSKLHPTTDVKLLSHRRIGYVGYKTISDATAAIKYFNKSFIRMSRIAVEAARPVSIFWRQYFEFLDTSCSYASYQAIHDDSKDPSQTAQLRSQSRSDVFVPDSSEEVTGNKLKRKRDDDEGRAPVGADGKLQEILDIMQPSSKSRTWTNEDVSRSVPSVKVSVNHSLSEREDEQKTVKRSKKSAIESTANIASPQADVKDQSRNDRQEADEHSQSHLFEKFPVDNDFGESIALPRKVPEEAAAVSDADWLRSRTSRLLDLADQGESPGVVAAANKDCDLHNPPDSVASASPVSGDRPAEIERERPFSREGHESELDRNLAAIAETGRLFIRNLPYDTSEDDLRPIFSIGAIQEVHLPINASTGTTKGFAYIQYADPGSAQQAYRELDKKVFQGRLLHILPAAAKRNSNFDEHTLAKLPLKKQKQIKRKAEAASSVFNWNSMYMNSDAVMSSISDRLGISKSDLLDPTSSDGAVKQAHAETHVIQETKSYLTSNGVDLQTFESRERCDTTILVKNFPYGTSRDEIKVLFQEFGQVQRLLMPPAGTIAIVEFSHAPQARTAFGSLAYRRFKDSVLFLEKGPKHLFKLGFNTSGDFSEMRAKEIRPDQQPTSLELLKAESSEANVETNTLFVRNLNFSTTTDRLTEVFRPLDGFMSARVKTKSDPKRPEQTLSMGFGFLEFRSREQAQAALSAMNGYNLDGHQLTIRPSNKGLDTAEVDRKAIKAKTASGARTKIIVKNLPFEASKKDVRSLFGAYGQLRSVRVPKRFDSSSRGFAFADFITPREAENAMDALKDTHLLGRRLVLDFAAADPEDAEAEIEMMQKKVGRQLSKVALQQLAGSGRKKLNLRGNEDLGDQ
ncbi:MAG: hypothetical protein M1819_002391 [Sarea resinae]|nr:MAG: hypothetical protein M1819_002391 [Sarea resinae]